MTGNTQDATPRHCCEKLALGKLEPALAGNGGGNPEIWFRPHRVGRRMTPPRAERGAGVSAYFSGGASSSGSEMTV